jgi:hypothetical protein
MEWPSPPAPPPLCPASQRGHLLQLPLPLPLPPGVLPKKKARSCASPSPRLHPVSPLPPSTNQLVLPALASQPNSGIAGVKSTTSLKKFVSGDSWQACIWAASPE